jgi:hypothetical protein
MIGQQVHCPGCRHERIVHLSLVITGDGTHLADSEKQSLGARQRSFD